MAVRESNLEIGSIRLAPVIELDSVDFPVEEFFGFRDERAIDAQLPWLAPQFYLRDTHQVRLSHHTWLLDTGKYKILIDPCVGNQKPRQVFEFYNMLDIPWLERLAAAGAQPEEIDFVFCTHLHADHCGWNTRLVDGRWVPTFPNACYLFSRAEADYWSRDLAGLLEPEYQFNTGVYADSVLPVIEAGQALILDGELDVANCLHIEPGIGHTPGHMIGILRSEQAGAVFAGDAIHHPLQIYYPDWCTNTGPSLTQQRATRHRILEACADTDLLLAPAHFRAPHVFRIRRSGPAFAICD